MIKLIVNFFMKISIKNKMWSLFIISLIDLAYGVHYYLENFVFNAVFTLYKKFDKDGNPIGLPYEVIGNPTSEARFFLIFLAFVFMLISFVLWKNNFFNRNR